MAFLNRCIWAAVSSGTGSFVVSAAAQGGYTPANCANPSVVNGAGYHYFAVNPLNGNEHEEGNGVFNTGTSTLTRAVIRNSSNGGAAVNFTSPPVVFMGGPISTDMPAVGSPIAGGTSGSVLFVDSSGNFAQDNANLSWDDTNNSLNAHQFQMLSGTITASTPLQITQTWNNAAVLFTAFSVNITNTASSGGDNSTVFEIIVDGATNFSSGADGFNVSSSISPPSDLIIIGDAFSGFLQGIRMGTPAYIGWTNTAFWFDTLDTGVARNAAGLVEFNNGTLGSLSDAIGRDLYTSNVSFLLRTKATLTNGAAASLGTLTNAPSAGNPTKWISIDDNGTTRKIPAW